MRALKFSTNISRMASALVGQCRRTTANILPTAEDMDAAHATVLADSNTIPKQRRVRKVNSSSATFPDASENEIKKQTAKVNRDDFWDDDVFVDDDAASAGGTASSTSAFPSTHRSSSQRAAGSRMSSSPKKVRSKKNPLYASSTSLKFLLPDLLKAASNQVSLSSSSMECNVLESFGRAVELDADCESQAIAFVAQLLSSWDTPGASQDLSGLLTLLRHFETRGANVACLRVSILIAKGIDAFLIASCNQPKPLNKLIGVSWVETCDSATACAASVAFEVIADVLYATAEHALSNARGKKRGGPSASAVEDIRKLCSTLHANVDKSIVNQFRVWLEASDAAERNNMQFAHGMFHLIGLLNAMRLLSEGGETAHDQSLISLEQDAFLHLMSAADYLLTEEIPERIAYPIHLAASNMKSWAPSQRHGLRAAVSQSFFRHQGSLRSSAAVDCETFVATAPALHSLVLREIVTLNATAPDVYGELCRTALSLAAQFVRCQNSSATKLTSIKYIVEHLFKNNMSGEVILSSQFCIGLSAAELLGVIRAVRNKHASSKAAADSVVVLPAIVTQTLLASIKCRVGETRTAHLDGAASDTDPSSTDTLDILTSHDSVQLMDDCVQLAGEFVLTAMKTEAQVSIQYYLQILQLAEKGRCHPDDIFTAVMRDVHSLSRLVISQALSLNQRDALVPVWAMLCAKLNELLAAQCSKLLVAASAKNSLGGSSDANLGGLSTLIRGLVDIIAATCSIGGNQTAVTTQTFKLFSQLVGVCDVPTVAAVLRDVAVSFLRMANHMPADSATQQAAAFVFQQCLLESLTAAKLLAEAAVAGSVWTTDWDVVDAFLTASRVLCHGQYSIESESAGLVFFRTDVLGNALLRHLDNNARQWVVRDLQAVAEVMFVRRSAHLISDAFDVSFTNRLVEQLHSSQSGAVSDDDASSSAKILALSTSMLQKGGEANVKLWLARFHATVNFLRRGASSAIFACLSSILNAVATHGTGVAETSAVVKSELVPMLGDALETAPLHLVVDSLRSMVHLEVVENSTVSNQLLNRIVSDVNALSLSDCGDVAGLIEELARAGLSAAISLPENLAKRVLENRMSATASEVAAVVSGFGRKPAATSTSKSLREQVIVSFILRTIQTAPQMTPQELLGTLEGYLAVQCSHMSLLGVILARVADSKEAFSLPHTVRLVMACKEAAKYDVRVEKACVTAAQPVFMNLIHHLLRNDVRALVATSNHAELILTCLCNAFPKEPIVDEVLRAVAHHAKSVPTEGICAALRLIAKRGSADFTAANSLFQHCLQAVIPTASIAQVAEMALELVRCGIRTSALFSAVEKRLLEVDSGADSTILSALCEAYVSARRENSGLLCRYVCTSISSEVTFATVRDFRLVLTLLVTSELVIPRDYFPSIKSLIVAGNELISTSPLLVANGMELEEALPLLELLSKLSPLAASGTSAGRSTGFTQAHVCGTAASIANSCVKTISGISGHAAGNVDVAKTVNALGWLVKLEVPLSHSVVVSCVAAVTREIEHVKSRHVLQTKMAAICSMATQAATGSDADVVEDVRKQLSQIRVALSLPDTAEATTATTSLDNILMDSALEATP